MPKQLNPATDLSPVQASKVQQDRVELLNPQIQYKRAEAILKSPPVRIYDLMECTDPGLPRTWVQFKRGADKEKYLHDFQDRAGVAHTGGSNYADRARASRKNRKNCAEEVEFEMVEGVI